MFRVALAVAGEGGDGGDTSAVPAVLGRMIVRERLVRAVEDAAERCNLKDLVRNSANSDLELAVEASASLPADVIDAGQCRIWRQNGDDRRIV
jgi:hypothetical protein